MLRKFDQIANKYYLCSTFLKRRALLPLIQPKKQLTFKL